MPHEHTVTDSDKHFNIDAVSMNITNTSEKLKLVKGDHKSEIFTFEMPRFIEGHDMTTCNAVKIHFNNIKADKTATSKDVYTVNDLRVDEVKTDTVIFSWLISKKATTYEGTLNFCIQFSCVEEEAVKYRRKTEIYKGISISDSFDNEETVVEDYSDMLEEWKQTVENSASEQIDELQKKWLILTNQSIDAVETRLNEQYEQLATDAERALINLTDSVEELKKNRPCYNDQKYPDIDMSAGYPENAVVTNTQQMQLNLTEEVNPICDMRFVKVADYDGTVYEWIAELNDIYINVGIGENVDVQLFTEAESATVDGYTKIAADGISVACLMPLGDDFNLVCATERDNVTYRGYTFPQKGVYFWMGSNADEGVNVGAVKTTSKYDIKKLDEKFMPDSYEALKEEVEKLKTEIASIRNNL